MASQPQLHRLAGPGFAIGSMLSVQLGAAVAVPVMVLHGSFGMTAMRLVCAALAMLVLARPNFASFTSRQWIAAMVLGTTMA